MISPLWWLPVTIGAIGLVPLHRGIRRLESELAGLRAAIARLQVDRPALDEVTAEIRATRHAVEYLARQ